MTSYRITVTDTVNNILQLCSRQIPIVGKAMNGQPLTNPTKEQFRKLCLES